jgi:hypothetical protein
LDSYFSVRSFLLIAHTSHSWSVWSRSIPSPVLR